MKRFLSDAKLFYAHAGLFAFAEIIFFLFLPILFWEQGFPLSFIFLFYGFASLPGYFFTTNILRYTLKIGIKKMLLLGVILHIFLGGSIILIQENNQWWIPSVIILAVQSLCYWPARHLYFSEIAHIKTVGLQSGILNAVMITARTLGPIVSGLLIVWGGFSMAFILGVIIMLLSALPIFFIKTEVESHFHLEEFQKALKTHAVFTTTKSAYIADGMNSVISYTFWPLLFFLFLGNKNYLQLGSLMTVTYGISAVIMVIVGHFFDQEHRKALLKFSVFSNIAAVLGRFSLFLFHPILFVYGIQSFYSFSESALQSTFEAYWYSYSKNTNTIFFTIHREMNFALGRFFIGMILAGACAILKEPKELWAVFLIVIPVVFVYLRKRKVDEYLENS